MMPGLADHLAAPPAAYAHLPYDSNLAPSAETLISLKPSSIRLLACKRSWDGQALVIRLQEAVGKRTKAGLRVAMPAIRDVDVYPGSVSRGSPAEKSKGQERGHVPEVHVPFALPLAFAPFEIKTLRIEPDGTWRDVPLIEEL
jgi:alpha-mannosidase